MSGPYAIHIGTYVPHGPYNMWNPINMDTRVPYNIWKMTNIPNMIHCAIVSPLRYVTDFKETELAQAWYAINHDLAKRHCRAEKGAKTGLTDEDKPAEKAKKSS